MSSRESRESTLTDAYGILTLEQSLGLPRQAFGPRYYVVRIRALVPLSKFAVGAFGLDPFILHPLIEIRIREFLRPS